MLVSFEGKVGQGKTLSATTFAVLDWLEADRKIVANYNIWLDRINYIYDDDGKVIEEREVKHPKEGDFVKFDYEFFVEAMENNTILYDTTVVLDEAYLFADARMSQSGFNKLLSYFVLQTRKRDVDLYLTTQQFENIDRRLRQNTDIRVLCLPKGTGIVVPVDKFINDEWKTEHVKRNVELIREGDEVVTFNPITSEKEIKKVLSVGNRIADELVHVTFSNGNELWITPEHPFAVPVNGTVDYVEAGSLKVGDEVLQYHYNYFEKRLQLLERGKNEEWKKQHGDKIKEKWQDENSGYTDRDVTSEFENAGTRKEVRAKVSASQIERYENHPEIKEQLSEIKKQEWADPNSTYNTPEFREARKLRAIEQYANGIGGVAEFNRKMTEDPEFAKSVFEKRQFKQTSLEKELEALLKEDAPDEWKYVGDGQVWFAGMNPDFMNINGKKKIIEVNGCYWHECEECGFGEGDPKEEKRIQKFNGFGWEVLTIWEHEFDDIEKVREKVREFTYNPDTTIETVVSINRIPISTRVFNIEVEDNNNYFAEGLLVHNCRYNKGTKVVTCRFVDLRSGMRRRIKIYGPEYFWIYDTKEIPTLRPGHIRAVQL